MIFKKHILTSAASAAAVAVTAGVAVAATPAVTATGYNSSRSCIENGYHYSSNSGVAAGAHCFATADSSTVASLASVDHSKTMAQLAATYAWSPLDPSHYLAQGTFATALVNSPKLANNSWHMAQAVNSMPSTVLPDRFKSWLRSGANIGGGVGANDNIPIYTVDSSNPNQTFANFSSTDARVVNFPKLKSITSGKIPLPSWAKYSDGGDHSLAIYDTGTGIWRSYYGVTKQSNGSYTYLASGYWYGDTTKHTAGDRNYWLAYVQGSSSVIGLSNELTQIGAQEVKNGVINHMVSVTLPNYLSSPASFPAKQSDGTLSASTNAPRSGQMFTFPKTFNVNAYVSSHHIDATTAAIMRAVQKYGGIVSDRNNWCMAFNFENPYGIGATASKGQNIYKTDKTLASKISAMNINNFPWQNTQWLAPNSTK